MTLRGFESWGLDTAFPSGWVGWGEPATIDLDGGRFADGCVSISAGFYPHYNYRGVRKTFDDAQRAWFIGMPIRVPDSEAWELFGLLSGVYYNGIGTQSMAYQVRLCVNASGFLEVYRGKPPGDLLGTGTHYITAGNWYFIEFGAYIDDTAGTVQVYIDGMLDIDLSGVDTQPLPTDTADGILLGGYTVNNSTELRLGQLYICDDQGTEHNTFLGDCRVIAQVPTGDGAHSDWTCSAGSDHYALVDDVPPDGDTTYVGSATVGAMDTFTFDDIGIDGTVIAVKVTLNAEKDEVGPRTLAPVIRQLDVDYIYTDVAPAAMSYGNFSEVFLLRPSDLNPWQVSDLGASATEFGVVVIS